MSGAFEMRLTYGVEESAFRAAPARENAGKSRPLVSDRIDPQIRRAAIRDLSAGRRGVSSGERRFGWCS